MPVDFLTADQEQQYGRYLGEPSPAQLARYFHLDDGDRALVLERRDEHVRLGLAVQLGTVRFLGAFLPDPTTVPAVVASFLATQLSIEDPSCLARYAGRPATQSAHAQLIRERYGYRDVFDILVRVDKHTGLRRAAGALPTGPLAVRPGLAQCRAPQRTV